MKYQDHQLLEDAYDAIVEKEALLEEGIFDRLKGTAAGIGKAAGRTLEAGRDMVDSARSRENFTGKNSFFGDLKKSGKDIKSGFVGGKSSSVIRSHVNKLSHCIDDFVNDLKKVGGVTVNSIANYDQVARFLKGIIKKAAKTGGSGKVSVPSLKTNLGQAGFLHPSENE